MAAPTSRLDRLAKQLSSGPAAAGAGVGGSAGAGTNSISATIGRRAADDVLILSAVRTPIGKGKRGVFKELTPDQLLAPVLKAAVDRSGVSHDDIKDIVVGTVLAPGGGADMARLAQLQAGLPYTIPINTCNRQCSSGLQAVMNIVGAIRAGLYDCGLAAGVESMSANPQEPPTVDWDAIHSHPVAAQCLTPMGMTSEIVAQRYGVTRQMQDELAAESQRRALYAQQNGLFDAETIGVAFEDEDGKMHHVGADEGIRPGTTVEKLGKLRPAFQEGGTTTAGNSSQVSDGAAAVVLMRRSKFEKLGLGRHKGLKPLGVVRAYAVVGVKPDEMGVGPAEAIPAALSMAGLSKDDIDVFEINEAFASQCRYCIDKLGLDMERVNPLGGAIALGHPLGCTGARQVATLTHFLRLTGGRFGVISMCIGTGMGAAAVIERE